MRTREVFFPPSREDARSTMMPPPAGVGVLACRGSSHLHEDHPPHQGQGQGREAEISVRIQPPTLKGSAR